MWDLVFVCTCYTAQVFPYFFPYGSNKWWLIVVNRVDKLFQEGMYLVVNS